MGKKPIPSPVNLFDPRVDPGPPALQADSLPRSHVGSPLRMLLCYYFSKSTLTCEVELPLLSVICEGKFSFFKRIKFKLIPLIKRDHSRSCVLFIFK